MKVVSCYKAKDTCQIQAIQSVLKGDCNPIERNPFAKYRSTFGSDSQMPTAALKVDESDIAHLLGAVVSRFWDCSITRNVDSSTLSLEVNNRVISEDKKGEIQ
jgi:hypothetical protein